MFLDLVVGIFLSLLPARLRQRWLIHWQRYIRESAVLSGLIELLGAVALLIFRYQQYSAAELARLDTRVMVAAAEKGGESAVQSLGMMILIAYVLSPLTLVLIYLAVEGGFRFGAAFGTGEVVGILPLVLVDKVIAYFGHQAKETMQGPRIIDLVFQPETEGGEQYDLGIASCRPKQDWDHLITIAYDGVHYEVAGYLKSKAPRRHMYLLKRAPVHRIVRHLHHYDPQEVLQPAGAAKAAAE